MLAREKGNKNIDEFLKECTEIFDAEFLVVEPEKLRELSKDPAVGSKRPKAFLYPSSLTEIKQLLQLANQFKVALWVYSTGKNWGYLNTTKDENSVVVILSRMNSIIKIDNELAYAEIEPGVTYEQLNTHLKENGFNLWTDSPGGPPMGSVIGNALDRGVGVTAYADHYAHLCGLEVVLPDGSVIHTGAVSESQKGACHLYKWGVGPIWEGMFSQSNFGIVTRAGIWLMRAPKDYSLLSLGIQSDKDLEEAIDRTRELMLQGTLPEVGRFSNDVSMLTLVTQVISEKLEGKRSISTQDLERLKKKYCIPSWQASFCLYGDREIVKRQSSKAFNLLKQNGAPKLFSRSKAARVRRLIDYVNQSSLRWVPALADRVCRMFFNSSLAVVRLLPSLIDLHEGTPIETVVRRGYFRAKRQRPQKDINVARDGVGILWFVPVLPFRGREIVSYIERCREDFKTADLDFYMTVLIFSARAVCPLMALLYDPNDIHDSQRAQELYRKLLATSQELGYQQFRAGIAGWPHLYDKQPELQELNNKIKAVLDPNKILAPGRYGIE